MCSSRIQWYINQTEKDKTDSEYRFEATVPSESLIFSIKMHYVDDKKTYYDIYILTSKSVRMRYNLYFLEDSSDERIDLAERSEYFTFECNKWHCINISNISIHTQKSLIFSYDIGKNEVNSLSTDLGHDYSKLLCGGEFSDIVTIKSKEGQEHKVHKAMLSCRSEVLKAHFDHDTTVRKTNVVETALENLVLVDVLAYIYCNIAPNIEDMPDKLFVAADYYQLNDLKSLCEENLKEKLCVDNALNILQLADLHSAKALKQFTLEFIKHEMKRIIKTDGWTKMELTPIIKDIIEYIAVDGNIKYLKVEC